MQSFQFRRLLIAVKLRKWYFFRYLSIILILRTIIYRLSGAHNIKKLEKYKIKLTVKQTNLNLKRHPRSDYKHPLEKLFFKKLPQSGQSWVQTHFSLRAIPED